MIYLIISNIYLNKEYQIDIIFGLTKDLLISLTTYYLTLKIYILLGQELDLTHKIKQTRVCLYFITINNLIKYFHDKVISYDELIKAL